MYSDGGAVAAVPAGVAGASLFAPGQAMFGLLILAAIVTLLGLLLMLRTYRMKSHPGVSDTQ